MLIYNFQKEFIGIDEANLEVFGFANLSEIKAESADFADMFVRTPGFIHNFKHVHWIDFVTCADPSEQSKVIIEVNSKTFKALLTIETVYLSDNPTSKAYLIHLNNLRSLTLQENGEFSEDIARQKPPKIEPTVGHAFNLSQEEEAEIEKAPELEGFKPFEDIIDTPKVEEKVPKIQEPTPVAPLDISFDDDDIDTSIFETAEEEPIKVKIPKVEIEESFADDSLSLDLDDLGFEEKEKPKEKTQTVTVEEDDDYDYSYNYDPQVASDELGLPIDLIEEFIQDFIAQAKEFKDELYSSLDEGDTDNIKILSHKLKGVAANLRVEDAFNTLSIINTSSDISEIGKYLNIFYKIIAKLSGEKIQMAKPVTPQATEVESEEEIIEIQEPNLEKDDDLFEDDLLVSFKDEEPKEEKEPQIEEDDDLFEDDLLVGFKDEEPKEEKELQIEEDDDLFEDDLLVGFKDEEPKEEKELQIEEDDDLFEDDLLVSFKDEEPKEEKELQQESEKKEEDDLYLDFDIPVKDSEVPQEIGILELADDDFSSEETIDIDDLLSIGGEEKIEEVIKVDKLEKITPRKPIIKKAKEVSNIKYSKELIANEIGLDQESFNEIFEDYLQDTQSSMNTIRKAIIEDDFTKCKKEALKLKGMSDNMRIHSFKDELTNLMSSTDKDMLFKAVIKIDAVIAQISK